ncbi:glycosyltransferase family 2 protein [Pedobacter sp.]|uniref:glycosyltransferase family 2 protein n=1 Tax=Pedobacter sp. TaxID=1411316 RepID=UPI003D7F84AD
MDKISIIIVTLNVEQYLQSCLTSIEKQKYKNLEVILVDGGSTDDTLKIIKNNNKIITHWVSEKDDGIYDAMNKALKLITGSWVYFLGADDVLMDDFSLFAKELKDEHIIYYGSVLKEGVKYYGKATPYQFAKSAVCHQAIIYPSSVFDKYKFDTKYKTSADYVLNMWCWKDANYKFKFIDFILANFNHTGVSSNKDLMLERDMSTLIYKNFGWVIWLRYLFKKLKSSKV